MKKILKKLDWCIDYYFVWMLYNGNQTHRYIEYMEKKWGKWNEIILVPMVVLIFHKNIKLFYEN